MNRAKNWCIIGLFLCFSGAIFHLSLQAVLLEKGFLAESKRESLESLVAERIKLETEIAQLSSLERIKALAESRLGMVPPEQIVYMVAGTRVGEGEKQLALNQEKRGEGKTR
ncbi:MAG: septum formation initiator family protein [Candidatus Caldatribacteriaceae bacterium]